MCLLCCQTAHGHCHVTVEGWGNEVVRSYNSHSLTTYPAFFTARGMARRPVPTFPFSRWMKVWRSLHRGGNGGGGEKERVNTKTVTSQGRRRMGRDGKGRVWGKTKAVEEGKRSSTVAGAPAHVVK